MIISFVPASAATTTGLDFENVFNYETASQTFLLPSTYEATICLPKNFTERGGVIVGNYTGEQSPSSIWKFTKTVFPGFISTPKTVPATSLTMT